jgi:hypothetical protein
MGRIKINDLPRDQKISKEEMRAITGAGVEPSPFRGLIGPNYRHVIPLGSHKEYGSSIGSY